jgi:hypothetical protein
LIRWAQVDEMFYEQRDGQRYQLSGGSSGGMMRMLPDGPLGYTRGGGQSRLTTSSKGSVITTIISVTPVQ